MNYTALTTVVAARRLVDSGSLAKAKSVMFAVRTEL